MNKLIWPMIVIMCTLIIAGGIHYGLKGRQRETANSVPTLLSQRFEPTSSSSLNANGNSETLGLVELARKARPAVVLIETFDKGGNPISKGSGFFISKQGHLVTNYHVVEGAYKANIRTIDGQEYTEYVMSAIQAKNENTDLAYLLVDPIHIEVRYLELAKNLPSVGESVAVFGNPAGLESTMSDGIVSAFRQYEDNPTFGHVLQMTAPISPGSSGGPVLNMKGEVVGVATFIDIRGQSLNFAIPFTAVRDLLAKIQDNSTRITGIAFGQNAGAVIGDRIVRVGDTVGDTKVIKIEKGKVHFEKNGKRWTQGIGDQVAGHP